MCGVKRFLELITAFGCVISMALFVAPFGATAAHSASPARADHEVRTILTLSNDADGFDGSLQPDKGSAVVS